MSRTFSTNRGSVESLKVSVRWGWRLKTFRMRWIVEGATPAALAIERSRGCAAVRGIPSSRLANDLGDLVIADLARRAGTGLVIETLDPMLCKPPPPFAHGVGRKRDPVGDLGCWFQEGGQIAA